jgi:hypothetical protein
MDSAENQVESVATAAPTPAAAVPAAAAAAAAAVPQTDAVAEAERLVDIATKAAEVDPAGAAAQLAAAKAGLEVAIKGLAKEQEASPEKSIELLPVSSLHRIKLNPNGWNFYSALFIGKHEAETGVVLNIEDKDVIDDLNQESREFSNDIYEELNDNPNDVQHVRLMMKVPIPKTQDETEELIESINARTDINEDQKQKMKSSVPFLDDGIYTTTRDESGITTEQEYMGFLSLPLNKDVLDDGPAASPDISLLLPYASKLLKASIHVYRPSKSQPDKYRLMMKEGDKELVIRILYKGKDNISALIPIGRTDASAIGLGGNVRKAIHAAKDSLERRAAEIGDDLSKKNIQKTVRVAKEVVMLDEDDADIITDTEAGSYFGGVVSFKEKYFPEKEGEVLETLKDAFNTFFKKDADLLDPLPPCDENHVVVILTGLTNRKETLFDEIQKKRNRDEDSIQLRELIVKYQQLESLVKGLEWQKEQGNCQNFDDEGNPGGFSKIDSEQEKEISGLLRQFAFVVLQAKNPVAEYSDRTDEATELVEALREDPLTPDKMDEYIKTWREQAKKDDEYMPNILAEILERTDTQTGLIDSLTTEQMDEFYKNVERMGRESFSKGEAPPQLPDTTSPAPLALTNAPAEAPFDPSAVATAGKGLQSGGSQREEVEQIVSKLIEEEPMPREKAYKLVKWIINTTREQWSNLNESKNEEQQLTGELSDKLAEIEKLSRDVQEAKEAMANLEGQVSNKAVEVAELQGEIGKAGASAKEKDASYQAEMERSRQNLELLKLNLLEKTKERDIVKAELDEIKGGFQALQTKATDSAGAVGKLQAQLSALTQQLALSTQQNQALQTANQTLQSQGASSSDAVTQLKATEAAAKAAAAAATSKVNGLETQIASLTKTLKETSGKEQAASSQLATLTATVTGLEKEITALQSGKTTDAKGAAEKDASIAQLTQQAAALTQQINAAKLEASTATANSSKVSGQIKEIQGLLDAQREAVTAKENERVAIKTQLDAKQREFDALKTQSNATQTQWVQKNNELAQVKAEASQTIEQAKAQSGQLEQRVVQAEQATKEHLQTIANNKDLLQKLAAAIGELDVKLLASIKDAEVLRKTVAENEANYSSLDAKSKAAAQQAKLQLEAIDAQKNAIAAELDRQRLTYQQKIDELEEVIKTQQGRIKTLEENSAILTTNLAESKKEQAELLAKLSAVQRTSDETIRSLGESLKAREAELNQKINRLNTNLQAAIQQLQKSQDGLIELSAELEAQKAIAEQVPGLKKQLQDYKLQVDSEQTKSGTQATQVTTILSELQNLASSIVAKKDYIAPKTLTPQASDAFMQIFANIKKMKETPAPSASNQVCFLSYFIIFFFKALFFATTETGKRQAALASFDSLTNAVIAAVRPAFPAGTQDKAIIYKIMEVIFGLIDASETLFINKETRAGRPAERDDTGVSVIKGKNDPMTKPIMEAIYANMLKLRNIDFDRNMQLIESTLVSNMLVKHPKVFFNKPMAFNASLNPEQDEQDLQAYPTMTFLPKGASNISSPGVDGRVQIIDVPAGFKRYHIVAREEWKPALNATMRDTTIPYSSLFAAFVVFGRKYLVAAKEDLKATCKIPVLLENPSSMLESMKADVMAALAEGPAPAAPAPAAPATATPSKRTRSRFDLMNSAGTTLNLAQKDESIGQLQGEIKKVEAAIAQKQGTSIKENALSLSSNAFRRSLMNRGLQVKA